MPQPRAHLNLDPSWPFWTSRPRVLAPAPPQPGVSTITLQVDGSSRTAQVTVLAGPPVIVTPPVISTSPPPSQLGAVQLGEVIL